MNKYPHLAYCEFISFWCQTSLQHPRYVLAHNFTFPRFIVDIRNLGTFYFHDATIRGEYIQAEGEWLHANVQVSKQKNPNYKFFLRLMMSVNKKCVLNNLSCHIFHQKINLWVVKCKVISKRIMNLEKWVFINNNTSWWWNILNIMK
jgi:hypothetical protein